MLTDLFGEEDDTPGGGFSAPDGKERLSVERTNPPRNETNLCGLANQGATCYLNALLQTLHFTPEFRQELFKLGRKEIGQCPPDATKHCKEYRLIPIQLQRLSARLLLADEQCISTAFLTDSFGWSDNEELFQHDVDEMNRILFSAIEHSLQNTTGSQIISTIYHGSFVNQIKCKNCSACREIKEDFLHIPVTVVGLHSLEESLHKQFVLTETLEGDNKYHCGSCDQLVDAVKRCHLRHLPPILSLALMRFQYDFVRNERYKETGKFSFPQLLDMSQFVDSVTEGAGPLSSDAHYELFSVVIHSGSTYGGHYKTYIRDIQNLGNWVPPEEEKILVPASKDDSNPSGYANYTNAIDLISAIISRIKTPATPSQICDALRHDTGISWSQRFKSTHGTFMKFMKKHPDVFVVDGAQKVSLNPNFVPDNQQEMSFVTSVCDTPSNDSTTLNNSQSSQTNGYLSPMDTSMSEPGNAPRPDPVESPASKKMKRQSPVCPPPGYRWFEINDRCVRPIHEKSITTMYGGKESAYMLFYRQSSIQLPESALNRPEAWLQDSWIAEVAEYNVKLMKQREEYEIHLNSICLYLHFATTYCYIDNRLQYVPVDDSDTSGCLLTITVDRRNPMAVLREEILSQSNPDLLPEGVKFVLHEIRDLPGGFHLYDRIPTEEDCEIKKHLNDNDHLFLWNGHDVHGIIPPIGSDSEPILITFTYPDPTDEYGKKDEEVTRQKDTLLSDIRAELLFKCDIPPTQSVLTFIKDSSYESGTRSKGNLTPVPLPPNKDNQTLSQLGIENGSQIIADRKGKKIITSQVVDERNNTLHLRIEDRCTPIANLASTYRTFSVDIMCDEHISILKEAILTKIDPANCTEGVRLRIEDASKGLCPPIHEDQTLKEAGINKNKKIIVEKGTPPSATQITISYHVSPISDDLDAREVILEDSATVGQCLAVIVANADLTGGWHLRKTNWCGEAAEILEDEEKTLDDAGVRDGGYLLVEEGRLPPKGFVRLEIFQLVPFPEGSGPSIESRRLEMTELNSNIELYLAKCKKEKDTKDVSVDVAKEKDSNKNREQLNDTVTKCNYVPRETDLIQIYPPLQHEIRFIDQIDISLTDTLDDLKLQIMTLGILDMQVPIASCLRVQEVVEGRTQRVLKDGQHTLKKFKLVSGSKLAVCPMNEGQIFPNSCLILNLALHVPTGEPGGHFLPPNEIVFDSTESSSPTALLQCISTHTNIPLVYLRVAKYRMDKFEWIPVREPPSTPRKKRKNKTSPPKPSVRNPPFNMKDNDLIGVKDIRLEDQDRLNEWYLEWDHVGLKLLIAIKEEKRRKRSNKGKDVFASDFGSRTKRAEVIPVIKFGDFSNYEPMDTELNGEIMEVPKDI
ncbi:Ubiquitin carboxyl-terminal hydrolase 40 [Oopsacas minuta]|uniref:Ubiquitin carboxyl-terminal hydrolase 40 n=1 Tax=Oopsacas minuta TaxID=111878 RepID=A0AAV7K878_9METZ|nr:Ubiquitin carboxyl-terminal hydrolase 40 [Oopsacas minuta]